MYIRNVDWWDEALRDHSYGNNVTFSARGGGEFVRYFTQLNYLNDNGILEPTSDNDGYSTQFKYSKLNIRTNLDITVSPTTTVQLNLFGNFSEHNRPGETTSNIFQCIVSSSFWSISCKNVSQCMGWYNCIFQQSDCKYFR